MLTPEFLALKRLCDAVQKDSQPISKEELYYVKPAWFIEIQAMATAGRKLLHEEEMKRKSDVPHTQD